MEQIRLHEYESYNFIEIDLEKVHKVISIVKLLALALTNLVLDLG